MCVSGQLQTTTVTGRRGHRSGKEVATQPVPIGTLQSLVKWGIALMPGCEVWGMAILPEVSK